MFWQEKSLDYLGCLFGFFLNGWSSPGGYPKFAGAHARLVPVCLQPSNVGCPPGADYRWKCWLANLCRDKIRPEVIPRIEMVRDCESARTVAVLSVEPGYTVHCRWHNGGRDYSIRVNDQTREPSTEELERLFQRRGNLRAELCPINSADIGCFYFSRIEEYFARIRGQLTPGSGDLDGWSRLLENTEIMAEGRDGVVGTLAGVVLFARNPGKFLPQAGYKSPTKARRCVSAGGS